jgi:hypothetical protein
MIHRMVLAALLVAGGALGEERFGARGQVVPMGSISYTHVSAGATDANIVNLAPGVLWFPTTAVALGASVRYQHLSGFFGGSTNGLGLEPMLGIALPLADQAALFPRVSMNFSWFWPGAGPSGNAITARGFVPVLFFPAPHFFIGFGPEFSVDLNNSFGKQTAYGVTTEIGGYF